MAKVPALEKPLAQPQTKEHYAQLQKRLGTAVKAYFDRAVANGDIVGAGVSIVRGDSIVISEGYGKRKKRKQSQS